MTSRPVSTRVGNVKNNHPSLIEPAMSLHRWLATVFVLLALAECTQSATGPGQAPYAPYSHDDERISRPDMM